ncbi:hypothetical protein DFH09DRAFT_934804 [Mycena vulgaris]|nr:hypothetical protein DFH09DRAFT_934804 [Mycena vulgaris]
MARMGRDMFDFFVGVLSRNQIFLACGQCPQRHVKYQLGCFLIRYGAVGSDTPGTAQKFSIGFGTVFLYCYRVCSALRELRPQYVGWPVPDRKLVIKSHINNVAGFTRCLSAGDRSLIYFEEILPPLYVPEEVFRGNVCSIKKSLIQATGDHKKEFTSFELGWPGSVTDAKIFKNSDIWKRRTSTLKTGNTSLKVCLILWCLPLSHY